MSTAEAPAGAPASAWQRKTLTVLFTDICGSTRLSRRMELEDYGALFSRIETLWQEAAQRHQGLVSRMQGDGAMVLFGHARADERDVVNAIDTALQIHARLGDLLQGTPLQARSGIHTGVALVRAGSAAQGLFNVMGEAPNIAGTLEKLARPGEVLVTLGSLKPHEGLYLLEPRDVPLVRDDLVDGGAGAASAAVVHVAARTAHDRRFDATVQRGLTPLIGCPALPALRAFLAPPAGVGERVAVVTAPAGSGKTRLLHELSACPELSAYQVLRGGCETYGQTELLQPFVQMLRARLADGLDDADVAGQLRAVLERPGVDELRDLLCHLAQRSPLLLIADDWQWADEASRRVLQGVLARPVHVRVLLAARPAAEGGSCMPEGLQLRVEPWTPAQTAQAVAHWLGAADPLLVAKLHQYAGGVPLLVEELCSSSTALQVWRQLEDRGTPPDDGLKLLVAARLDRLPPALAAIVQAAAVVGIELPLWLLQVVCEAPPDAAQLQALADADFLYPTTRPGVLRFKHGLTRAAVYAHVALHTRQAIHWRARQALQAHAADTEHLGALAYHCDGAGDFADAAHFGELAGHAALGAFSMDLARGYFQRAMRSLDRVQPATRALRLHWCALACRYAMASVFDPLALGNDASLLEQAVRVAQHEGDAACEAECRYWLAYLLYGIGRFHAARDQALQALAQSRAAEQPALAAQVEATLGEILVGTCAYDEALARIDAALQAKRQRADQAPRARGLAIGTCYALACKGSLLADRGDFSEAEACFGEALALLADSTHPVGNSVRNWITVAYLWQGRWDAARRVAQESERIAQNTGALYLVAVSRATLGFARWCEDGDLDGLQQMDDAVRWMAGRRGQLFTSLLFGWLAEACVVEGRGTRARSLVAQVLHRTRQGERLGEAIAARAMALQSAGEGEAARAERWLERAEHSARARGSRREAALNAVARTRVQQRLVGDGRGLADQDLSSLRALGVALPFRER
jgi:tetratricopeptide (TPR) repeat protein